MTGNSVTPTDIPDDKLDAVTGGNRATGAIPLASGNIVPEPGHRHRGRCKPKTSDRITAGRLIRAMESGSPHNRRHDMDKDKTKSTPAGAVELTEDDLSAVAGGFYIKVHEPYSPPPPPPPPPTTTTTTPSIKPSPRR